MLETVGTWFLLVKSTVQLLLLNYILLRKFILKCIAVYSFYMTASKNRKEKVVKSFNDSGKYVYKETSPYRIYSLILPVVIIIFI